MSALDSQRLRESLSLAMDAKEAVGAADPFAAHMRASDVAALMDVECSLEGEMASPRPAHHRLEKLISLKASLGRSAHVSVSPEEQLWRQQLDDAVDLAEQ